MEKNKPRREENKKQKEASAERNKFKKEKKKEPTWQWYVWDDNCGIPENWCVLQGEKIITVSKNEATESMRKNKIKSRRKIKK